MTERAWMIRRALLAVALMAGFYVLAVGIAVGLLLIPYGEWQLLHRVHLKIAAVCIGGAGAILWAIMPRPDKFEAPGPALTREKTPKLFAMVDEIAAATKQPLPSEVFLLNEVNAWVTYRGGVMGFGSHRVMGIGLPLLQALSVSELKAVLAHEFGHYVSGDVSIGPWIYKTRAAIGRAIQGLNESMLQTVFLWYGNMFLRLTQAVSRRQEYIADEIAAKLAGADAMKNALRRVAALSPAHNVYLSQEVLPVMNSGFLPPVAAGFERFIAGANGSRWMSEVASAEEQSGETDEFDSHPCLKDRLQALDAVHADPQVQDNAPATTLLPNPEHHARSVLSFVIGSDQLRELKAIQWDQVGSAVYEPSWRAMLKHYTKLLDPMTTDTIPQDRKGFAMLGSRLVDADEGTVAEEIRIARAVYLLTAAIGIVLADAGWKVSTSPGEPVKVTLGDDTFDPREALQQLAANQMSAQQWRELCERMGISNKALLSADTSSKT
jgi:Zn-dependent protease with chaperone function